MKNFTFLLIFLSYMFILKAQDPEITVNKLSEKPTIDGLAEGIWDDISEQGMGFVTKCEGDNCNPSPSDASVSWKVAWDDDFFYFHATITDESLNENPNGSTKKKSHKYDALELFFDTDGVIKDKLGYASDSSRGMSQLRFNYGVDPTFTAISIYDTGYVEYDGSKALVTDLGIESAQLPNGSTGWFLEAAIPWGTIYHLTPDSIPGPSNGKLYGFEVHYGDNDGGDDIESMLMWNNDSGIEHWDNVIGWSLIQLTDPGAVGVNPVNDELKLLCYPNPAGSNLNIKSPSSIVSYTIHSVLGAVVLTETRNASNFSIDLSELSGGVYFISFNDDQNRKLIKKIVKR